MREFSRFISFLLVLSIVGANCLQSSFAAYDRVVTWSDMSDLDLSSVLSSRYASESNLYYPSVGPAAIDVALSDADNKISKEFHVPEAIKPAVEFWMKIYTTYGSQEVVLFDAKRQGLIYDVLDFRDLAKTSRNNIVYELVREKRINNAVKAYHAAFEHLARSHAKHGKTPEEQKILAATSAYFNGSKKKLNFRDLNSNFHMQTGQRDNVIKGLLAAENYFPRMEKIFSALGVPPEVTRVSLVESSFDLRAYSRVGAVGIWQFMPESGGKFLIIDDNQGIDERLSPLKSTVAAGRMLRETYQRFKNWPLAITSYNHGLRGLTQFSHGSAGPDFRKIAYLFNPDGKKGHPTPLGWAARNYYPEFLAMLHAESYRELFYGDMPVVSSKPVVYQKISERESVLNFAERRGLSLQQLVRSNPDILNVKKPLPKEYWVAVPAAPGSIDDLSGLTAPKRLGKHAVSVARASTKKTRKI